MFSPFRQGFLLLCCSGLLALISSVITAAEWQYETEGRIIAVSDVHGAYDDFLNLLRGLGLVDADKQWAGAGDHLVVIGDVLDRGAASREVLELIMSLQAGAAKTGGRVHMLLGNHEIMNLVGDLRYVALAEFARYRDLERAEERDAALARFRKRGENRELDEERLLAAFTERYPPGFFGHQRRFGAGGEFGGWLLQRPAVIRINDSIFAHGGLSGAVAGRTLAQINEQHRRVLEEYTHSRAYFIEQGILDAAANYYDQPHIVKERVEAMAASGDLPEAHLDNARKLIAAYRSEIFDGPALTWYRGNVGCSAAIEQGRLGRILEGLGGKRLVIGHTPTSSRAIESRFDDMLIRVDTGMLNSHYRGQAAAAVIGPGGIGAYYPNRPGEHVIVRQPRRVGPRSPNLGDDELERVLALAPVQDIETRQDGTLRLAIDYEGQPIEALFAGTPAGRRPVPFLPQVAAYRLDRYLGLDMVPVAVAREVDGKRGAITLDLTNLIDESERISRQLGASAWCPLQDQFEMMYLLDILLHNRGREKQDMRYRTGNMRLILTGNDDILGTQRGVPRYLRPAEFSVPPGVQSKLRALDGQVLEGLLGDVLGEKRQKAVLKRRDWLLKHRS